MTGPWQTAAEPIEDGASVRIRLSSGAYEVCVFHGVDMTEDTYSQITSASTGEATWENVKVTWGPSEDGEDFIETLR